MDDREFEPIETEEAEDPVEATQKASVKSILLRAKSRWLRRGQTERDPTSVDAHERPDR